MKLPELPQPAPRTSDPATARDGVEASAWRDDCELECRRLAKSPMARSICLDACRLA